MGNRPDSDTTHAAPPLPTLGRYTLLTKLATGGMAEIFLARQAGPLGFEKIVVIKRILDSYAEDPDFVAMFLDEARIAAQLSHQNIVQIFDLGDEHGTYYIAMEYLAGESLAMVARTAMQRGAPLPVAFAARWVASAAEALSYAHLKADLSGKPLGIVHRDVSPHNLFVTYEGTLKVLDFGIAKAANRATKTVGNQVKGTMAYMAPEQVQGKDVDARADLFSLGVVLFEAVTHSRLFQRDEPGAIYQAVVGPEPIPRASERNPEVPPELDEIIATALERDRSRRFQSAEELHQALEGWLRSAGAPSNAELAGCMRKLFQERIERRNALLERAQRGEEISSVTISRRNDTSVSMPGQSALVTPPARSPMQWVVLGAGVGLGALALGGGAFLLGQRKPPEPQVLVVNSTPPPPAPAAATRVEVDTDPPKATLVVDGVEKGKAPLSLSGLALGKHELVARLDGRPEASRTLVLETAGQVVEVLLRLPAPPPPPTPAPAPPPPPTPAETKKPVASVHKPAEPAGKPAASAKMGKLTLDTQPWTQVFLGGKSLGETPLAAVPLPAGTHRLRLVNPDQNLEQSVEVVIEPDKTTVTRLHF